ncbi:MAG: hypothetical protein QOJ12_2855, partial [Thermoleophilales bacterium]|nr:hypothetical protein [Thermoleophilales bacterium]
MVAMQGIWAAGMSARRAAAGVVTALALMLATASAAGAATYTATTFADDVPANTADCPPDAVADGCSLREAVEASNQTGANDEIVLAAGRYELNTDLEAGAQELSVNRATGGDSAGSLLIRGAGARATTIDGNASASRQARVFHFNAGSIAELRDLGVTGGYFSDARGGAITVLDDGSSGNDAQVTLTRTAV